MKLLAAAFLVLPLTTLSPAVGASDLGRAPVQEDAEVMTLAQAHAAGRAFDAFLRAYEQGDLTGLRARLDPGFIGYQALLDAAQQDFHALRLIRVHLARPRVTAGRDVAVIQTTWEKRFVDAVTFQPGLTTGQITVLMHRMPSGWQLAAVHGQSPFWTRPAPAPAAGDRAGARLLREAPPR
jgi:hypothetical protein